VGVNDAEIIILASLWDTVAIDACVVIKVEEEDVDGQALLLRKAPCVGLQG